MLETVDFVFGWDFFELGKGLFGFFDFESVEEEFKKLFFADEFCSYDFKDVSADANMVMDCIWAVVAVFGAAECAHELLVVVKEDFFEEGLMEFGLVSGVRGLGFEGLADGGFLERRFWFGCLFEAGEEWVSRLRLFGFGWGVLGVVAFEHFLEFLFNPVLFFDFL